ncbi:MAG: zinc ABC transporter substrate-binding protein [Ignavibacteriae bacterium]|nr:zinc ABC transporter substrate-binding protein [Ignavibacteriota bacterium]
MKKISFTFILVITSLFAHELIHAQQKLKVVTTLNVLKYVAQQVGGDKVEVTALANPKQDPHYVTPTPRMNELARNADLFVELGLNLDLWSKNVVDASGNPRIQSANEGRLIASINVPVKELPIEVSRVWGDLHPQGNPHIWLDPLNIKIIAENFTERLTKLDPSNDEYYQARLEKFKHRIDATMFGEELLSALGNKAGDILSRKTKNNELEHWLKSKNLETKLNGWMKKAQALKGLKIITYHKTYIYFAERFGLNIMGELEEKPGIPPPPKHRDAIVELVKREGMKVILNDNFYSRDAADYVASKTGAKVLMTYIDVGASEEVDTYEKLITYLLEKLIQATS